MIRGAIRDGISELTTSVCITKSDKLMNIEWQGRISIGVCFCVVMMRDVVECLEGPLRGIRVV